MPTESIDLFSKLTQDELSALLSVIYKQIQIMDSKILLIENTQFASAFQMQERNILRNQVKTACILCDIIGKRIQELCPSEDNLPCENS